MSALETELTALTEEREKINKRIATATARREKAQNELADAERARTHLMISLTPAEQLMTEIKTIDGNLAAQRKTATLEFMAAEDFRKKAIARVAQDLTDARRAAIQKAIERVDTEIKDDQSEVTRLEQAVAAAESALAAAKTMAATDESGLRDTLSQLRQLPAQVTAGQRQIAAWKAAIKLAEQHGDAAQAFYVACELETGLEQLAKLLDPAKETDLRNKVVTYWKGSAKAQGDVSSNTTTLQNATSALNSKRVELQRRQQQRDANIKAGLASPEGEPTPPKGRRAKGNDPS